MKESTVVERDSTANGTWTFNGSAVDCVSPSTIRCVTAQGSTTLYSVASSTYCIGKMEFTNAVLKGAALVLEFIIMNAFNKLFTS